MAVYLIFSFSERCMSRMSLLPQELSGPYKRLGMFELPSLTMKHHQNHATRHSLLYSTLVSALWLPKWYAAVVTPSTVNYLQPAVP